MITDNQIRFGKMPLYTIVSREIIKPSSPTPFHLRTYNLSVIDQIISNAYMPMVAFFPNTGNYRSPHDKTLDLKISLSQTLTKYYPFAGTHTKVSPAVVDCNDNGAEFLEASINSKLSDFLQNSQHEDLDQFFPHGLVWCNSNRREGDLESDTVIPLAVQVNHFECGGVAVAVSLSHKIADGSSLVHFINDWAKMTRFCSDNQRHDQFQVAPKFNSYEYMNLNYTGLSLDQGLKDCVTRSFMFPNSIINEFKSKIKATTAESGEPITNPTRVEVLTWQLYKCAVAAATKNNAGSFKPTGVREISNLRGHLIEPLHEMTVGNFSLPMVIVTENESEMKPDSFISELKKKKMQFQGLRNIETVFGLFSHAALKEKQKKFDDMYICSSICRFPTYEIDFGWGKPVKVTFAGNLRKNSFFLMDAANMDGIEALVCLGKQDMEIIQSGHELLSFS